MQMLISNDWLRTKIAHDPDVECDAGIPVALLENLGMFVPADLAQSQDETITKLKMAFGTFIHQLRRRDGLTYAALAEKARVEAEELKAIEHDAHYIPRPRTIHNLATAFELPPRELMKLSGATRTVDSNFQDKALRFAASSDDALSDLSNDERTALNEYVKYLSEQHEQK